MRSGPVVALLAGALTLAGAAAATAAPSPTPVTITGPAADALVRTSSVTVTARVPRGVTRATVRINGTDRPARCAAGTCRLTVTRPLLRTGANILEVRAQATGRQTGRDTVLFDVIRRRPGLVAVTTPRAVGGTLVVRSAVPRARQLRFTVTLNGRRIERRFDGQPGPVFRLGLGAGEGLRHGRNTIKVLVVERGGTFSEITRAFTVASALPIAGAGPDRVVRAATPVTLRARALSATAGAGPLSYRWSVVSSPVPLSLESPGAQTLTLTPPAVGTYTLRLTATQGGRSSSDLVTITSQPVTPPIGIPVNTGAAGGISVGGTTYGLDAGDAVIALALDRATLTQVLPATSYAASEASTVQSAIANASSGRSLIVMLANPTGTPLGDKAWAQVVSAAGGTVPASYFTSGGSGFSLIGIAGDKGNAYQSFPPSNVGPGMTGYLQVGGNGFQYRFAASEYPSFNTSAASGALSNTMTIGGSTYTSDAMPACATGGFQWVIVSALTLELQAAGTTATNGCGADDAAAQYGLSTNLRDLPLDADRQPSLVFLQSIGSPRDVSSTGTAASWNALTAAVASLGGTAEVFWGASQPYALVGSSPGGPPRSAAEASTSLTGGPGVLSGQLRRGHDWTFLPSLATPGTTAAPIAAQIAYQAPTAWPLSSSPAQIAAMNWIAQQLNLVPNAANSCEIPAPPGPRGLYCTDEGWSNQRQNLAALQYSANPSFTAADLTAAKGQLDTEFNYVANIYTSSKQLTSILGQQSQKAKVDLNTITQQVVADVDADGQLNADLTQLVSDLLTAATYFAPPTSTKVAGALASILQVAVDTGEDPQSGLPLSAQVQARAKDLGASLDAYFQNADTGVKHVTDIIVSDWGKLSAAAANPGFQSVSTRTQEQLVTLSKGAIGGWIWGKLMPMAYQLDILRAGKLNPNPNNPATYTCSMQGAYGPVVKYHPFGSLNQNPLSAAKYQTPVAKGSAVNLRWVLPVAKGSAVPGDKTFFSEFPGLPPASQMNTLFQAIDEGGLGQFPAQFFPRYFGSKFTPITC